MTSKISSPTLKIESKVQQLGKKQFYETFYEVLCLFIIFFQNAPKISF